MLSLMGAACAPKRFVLPTDPGTPLPDFAQISQTVSQACRSLQTFTAGLNLSGHSGAQALGGRVDVLFKRPSSIYLQLTVVARRQFILAGEADKATLLLLEEKRVLPDERVADMLEALTALRLAPPDLQAVLTGCVVPEPKATGGTLHADGVASIMLAGGATLYLRKQGPRWQVRAARRDGLTIEYPQWPSGASFPAQLRILSSMPVDVDLRATLADVEANTPVDDGVFSVRVRGEQPISLEELREAGPLGQK